MTSANALEIESTLEPVTMARPRAQVVFLALSLAASGAIVLGFGRFGYALVLPAMRQDLHWSYGAAGLLNTANALGYLAGAVSAALVLQRLANRTVLLGGLGLAAFALCLAGCFRSYGALLFCRALVGWAGAFAFISASGLAARLGRDDDENALAMGITVAGPGFGTIATGLLVPRALSDTVAFWPRAWLVMGSLGALVWLALLFITRAFHGREGVRMSRASGEVKVPLDFSGLYPVLAAYFLFGLGYIAYMTFLVAYVRGLKTGGGSVALVWTVLGCAMVSSAFAWRSEVARNRGGRAMAAMGVCGALSALLPLLSSALPVLLLSAVGFGVATMPVFTAVGMLIRRHMPPALWNGAFALATVIFAAGQSMGPFLSGTLSDHFGLTASLWWTAVLLGVAALVVSRQRPHTVVEPREA